MAMDVWRPRVFRSLRPIEEMERFMEESFPDWPFLRTVWRRVPGEELGWSPSIEMYDRGERLVIRAELPGVKKEDVDISVTGEFLTIKGERKAPADVRDEQYYRCELCYGPFSRTISFPASGVRDKIEAQYADGVLEVHLPKAQEAITRKIEIQAK